jgi:hypothetical protein
MENNKIINGNCWLAYFDILGFSNMVENFPVEFVKESYKKALKKGEQFNSRCKFKWFSDSFIFYIENDSLDSYRCIRTASILFFRDMFLKEIPMRGCLNVGQLYADEENGIFFGPALIDAHDFAENQEWIGFILSKEAREKIKDYELAGFKTDNDYWFQEYNVPYKDKEKSKRYNLLVYKLNILNTEYSERLWIALNIMERKAFLSLPKDKRNNNINTCSKCKRIFTKYRNTEDYLLSLYPSLQSEGKKRIERIDQNELCAHCARK